MINKRTFQQLTLYTLLSLTSILSLVAKADEAPNPSTLKENTIIGYSNYGDNLVEKKSSRSRTYRKLLKINADGSYLVQDFYIELARQYTDPYLITNAAELMKVNPSSIEGQMTIYRRYFRESTKNYRGLYWFDENLKQKSYFMKDGQFEGLYTEWDRNGQLQQQGHFQAGKEQGLWIIYENGGYKTQGMMKDGNKEGLWIASDPNGNKIAEYNYQDGYLTGDSKKWYPYTLVKAEKGQYQHGKKQGQWLAWYANGQLKTQQNYWQGNFEGDFKAWDEKGQLTEEGAYQEGKKVGLWAYYKNNVKYQEMLFLLNGGQVTRYYRNGGVLYEERYKKNNENDESQWRWYDNGHLERRTFSKKGRSEGEHGRWNKEGKLIWKATYKEGKKISSEGNYYGY